MTIKQYLYKFVDTSIESDLVNQNNKITRYKTVNSIAENAQAAKEKANLDDLYVLYEVESLNENWNV